MTTPNTMWTHGNMSITQEDNTFKLYDGKQTMSFPSYKQALHCACAVYCISSDIPSTTEEFNSLFEGLCS